MTTTRRQQNLSTKMRQQNLSTNMKEEVAETVTENKNFNLFLKPSDVNKYKVGMFKELNTSAIQSCMYHVRSTQNI